MFFHMFPYLFPRCFFRKKWGTLTLEFRRACRRWLSACSSCFLKKNNENLRFHTKNLSNSHRTIHQNAWNTWWIFWISFVCLAKNVLKKKSEGLTRNTLISWCFYCIKVTFLRSHPDPWRIEEASPTGLVCLCWISNQGVKSSRMLFQMKHNETPKTCLEDEDNAISNIPRVCIQDLLKA